MYQNQNTPIDAIYSFCSKMENETKCKVILAKISSNITSEYPPIYKFYIWGVSTFTKYDYQRRKNNNSYSFLITDNKNNHFILIAKTINDRIYEVNILYDNCSLEREIIAWKNYLLSNLPEIKNILSVICRKT